MDDGRFVEVEGLRLHYVERGSGDPVLLLHGWPTSSYLWRGIVGPLGERNRAIAIDLPGFGRSDKPLDRSYSFRFFERVLDGFLAEVGVDRVGLAVHDIGGPIGVYWAARRPERLTRLALLNTLVYSRLSWAAVAFVAAVKVPGVRAALTSQPALRWAMRYGVHDRSRLSDETIRAYQAPFRDRSARRALQKAAGGLHPDGLREIERWLPNAGVPFRLVYGARDRILPDVDRTMRRIEGEAANVEVTRFEDCGHFLQEERPKEIAAILAEFFGGDHRPEPGPTRGG